MTWLLDTCVVFEYVRKDPRRSVIAWLDDQDEASLYLSAMSIGEIEKGILKLRTTDRIRSQRLAAWLIKLEKRFGDRVLPLDSAALHWWAQLSAQSELAGRTLPVIDALIMATAMRHGFTVVTRNVQDFAIFPRVFNPWEL